MHLMGRHTTWAIPMGNMVRLGLTRSGQWAGWAGCSLLLQGAVIEEASVSRDLEIAVFL